MSAIRFRRLALVASGLAVWCIAPRAWGSPQYTILKVQSSHFSLPNDSGQVAASTLGSPLSLFDGFGSGAGAPGRRLDSSTPGVIDQGAGGVTLLNNRGQAAVTSWVNWGSQQGVLVSEGRATPMGTLGGSWSTASGLNDSGQAVGASTRSDGGVHAFSYQNGAMTDLGTLPGGGYSNAKGVNNAGDAVGYSDLGSGRRLEAQGAIYASGEAKFLNPSDGSMATVHATLFRDGQNVDLGTLGGTSSYASAINDSGTIVGAAQTDSGLTHAFIFKDGKMTDLGVLDPTGKPDIVGIQGSAAYGINAAGTIVGSSFSQHSYQDGDQTVYDGSSERAFVYQDGKMIDLNDIVKLPPDTILMRAYGINNLGQILVEGYTESSMGYAFDDYVLTPSELGEPNYAIEAPEPTTLAMPALLAAWLGARTLSRRRRAS